MGCVRTTPINVLHHIAGIPTLQFRLEYLSGNYLVRCFSRVNHPIYTLFNHISNYLDTKTSRLCINNKINILYNVWQKYQNIFTQILVTSNLYTFSIPYFSHFLTDDNNSYKDLVYSFLTDQKAQPRVAEQVFFVLTQILNYLTS